jgi:dTDP-glucose 4,6-dehydratase
MKRYAVLGSNSFTGSHFVQHLLASGHDVLAVSRSPRPHAAFLPDQWGDPAAKNGRLSFHQLDLNDDIDAIDRLLTETATEIVVNFASQSMVAQSWEHPEHWYRTNVLSTVRLCERLRKRPALERYVHVSTPEVYGSMEGLVPEHTTYKPSTPYATSRAAADMHLMNLHQAFRFPVVFTRAANVYGPGQQLYRIIPRAILSVLCGRKLPLDGGGRSVRSFIHVRDVCDATKAIAERAEPPAIFHLSTERTLSIRELVELICRRMNASFDEVVEVRGERPGKDQAYLLDSAKARRELGWTDCVTLEAGVDETIAWAGENLAALQSLSWDYIHKI